MSKEQKVFDKFVDVLLDRLDSEPSAKDLEVVLKFIQHANLQADPAKHKGLNELSEKLPFEDEDILPLRVVK